MPEPFEVEYRLQLGLHYLANQERELALLQFDQVIAWDPNHFEAWVSRALTLAHLQRYPASIEQSLQINPSHANGIYNKGYCFALMGCTREAVDCIAEAIRLNPKKYGPAARTDPDLDRLRKNKRFQALLAKLPALPD